LVCDSCGKIAYSVEEKAEGRIAALSAVPIPARIISTFRRVRAMTEKNNPMLQELERVFAVLNKRLFQVN
jgi:hypothetical protein